MTGRDVPAKVETREAPGQAPGFGFRQNATARTEPEQRKNGLVRNDSEASIGEDGTDRGDEIPIDPCCAR